MSFYNPLSILFYITFLLVLGCKPKEKDLIDMALGELEKYHKIANINIMYQFFISIQ